MPTRPCTHRRLCARPQPPELSFRNFLQGRHGAVIKHGYRGNFSTMLEVHHMKRKASLITAISVAVATLLAGCSQSGKAPAATDGQTAAAPTNVIFFLGDGMGMATLTAARIYSVGEDGDLTIDTLPETAFVKTFSNDAQ